MLFDDLGSTSWHHRNYAVFARLDELLVEAGVREPRVVIVGPGAVTRAMAPLLNDALRPGSLPRKVVGDAARYADQVLRRIPLFSLRSLEAVEVSRALSMPHALVVVDRSPRLLDAVRRDLPEATCRAIDITRQPIVDPADVVIALNVISRLGAAGAVGVRNILAALNGGGLLVMDDRSARAHLADDPRLTPIAPKTHRVAPNAQ